MTHTRTSLFLFWLALIPAVVLLAGNWVKAQTIDYSFTYGIPEDNEVANDIVIDNAGRALVGGTILYDPDEAGYYRGFVLRITPFGKLDETFGDHGVVIIDFPNSTDEVNAITLNSAGDILLAGKTNLLQACVYKLNGANGSLVNTFGNGGRAILPQAAEFADLLVLPNQQIIAVGWGIIISNQDANYVIARFNANGTLDPSYGTNNGFTHVEFEDDDFPYSVDRQSDGKIIVGGESWTCSTSSCEDFSVARLLPDGQFDPSFGSGGKLLFKSSPQTGATTVRSVGLQNVNNEERVLFSGLHSSSYKPFLYRLRNNGTSDPTFGSYGFKDYTQPGLWAHHTIQADNKILLAGSASSGFSIMRTQTDGSTDGSFGINGVSPVNLGKMALVEKIITAGNAIYVTGSVDAGPTDNAFVVKLKNTNVVGTASADAAAIGMTIFPNPSSGDVSVRFVAPESGEAMIRIFNLTGQPVFQMPIEQQAGTEQTIALAFAGQLSAGTYLLQLQSQTLVASRMLVIQK